MKILVTGGAGFIGSHLVEALLAKGHRVTVLDDLSTGHAENLRPFGRKVALVRGDCADESAARKACRGVSAVFHLAAMPSVPRSVKDPLLSHRTNATATLTMLVAARDAGARRFVYAGSSAVYGDLPTLPKREDMPTRPLSPYGLGKLAGEHYVRLFSTLYGMETLTLRYFNVFGPRQDPGSPYSGVISLFVTALIEGRRPVIYGDGRQTRDFTYVANVVDANLRALTAKGLRGQTVNVATGKRISLLDLHRELSRELGVRLAPERRPTRAGDIKHSQAAITAARHLLGYRPIVSFRTGIRITSDWYRGQTVTHDRRRAGRN
jgi:UDP-N-acetylglucosamine/UDP-N-acetyl-alpha-D-glucosaminouronate 4-epimerase